MDIVDEFKKVFRKNEWFSLFDEEQQCQLRYAQADYRVVSQNVDIRYKENCLRVDKLVRANLLLCLTAPHPYIRKWAQLIREENK
jgi:hypothetical protein